MMMEDFEEAGFGESNNWGQKGMILE
jgi:hypothetical protein